MTKKVLIFLFFVLGTAVFLKSNLFCSQVRAACVNENQAEQVSTEIGSQYFTFTQDKLDESLKDRKTVVLYFHAPWCTTCTDFDQELRTEKDQLPPDLIVLQVPYDSAIDLRTKYHVTTQHTLVLLDQDGQTKEIWIGGDLQSLLKYLKK